MSKKQLFYIAIISVLLSIAPAMALPWGAMLNMPAYAPSAADITNTRGRAVNDTEEVSTGASISTTTVNAMAAKADIEFSDELVQNFRVINTHATQNLCLKTVDRGASATSCSSACGALAAGDLTCAGAGAADGLWLPGGSTAPFTYPVLGTECLCAEASAASTTYQITRVARKPNQ